MWWMLLATDQLQGLLVRRQDGLQPLRPLLREPSLHDFAVSGYNGDLDCMYRNTAPVGRRFCICEGVP